MSFKKSIFHQFGKHLKDETKAFKAFQESRKIKFKRCKHKNAKIVDGELRCPDCGAAWAGPRIVDLLNKFRGKIWRKK